MPKAIKANDAEINLFISISEPQSIARSAKAILMSKERAKRVLQNYACIIFLIEDNSTTKLKFQVSYT